VPRPHTDDWLPAGASQWRPHRKGHRWPTSSRWSSTGSASARRRFCALAASGRLRPVGQQW